MTQLTKLGLFSNQLTGTLPVAWSSMSQLTVLGLNTNQLTGTLPVAWSSMTQLTILDLLYFFAGIVGIVGFPRFHFHHITDRRNN